MSKFWDRRKRIRVEKCVAKWVKVFGLGYIQFQLFYEDDPHSQNAAHVETDTVYNRAKITFNRFSVESPNDLDQIVRHELLHVITEPIVKCAFNLIDGRHVTERELSETCERVVEHLSRVGFG